ncbi:MAG: TonB family protein, partial [candidate division Zixibacteria bacterium]|nr:TonB family protein [candidate division Zixibacteria bacterium]
FKKLLLEKRAGAAQAIGLKLTAAEEAMLAAVPLPQLEGIISHTRISPKLKPVFLGYAAGTMLATLGTGTLEYTLERYETSGNGNTKTSTLKLIKTYRARYKNLIETRNGSTDAASRPAAGATGILADRPPGNGDFDRVISQITAGMGARPDFPTGIKRARRNKGISVATSMPASVVGEGASHKNRSPHTVANVVRRHLTGIRNAYVLALKKNPTLGSGKIIVRFTIAPRGSVTAAQIVCDTLGEPALSRSILVRVRAWRFPPADGGYVTVIYPFIFIAAEV